MTTPIQNSPLLFQEPPSVPPPQPLQRQAPHGLGSVPDRLDRPRIKEKGYIERGVLAIRDWVIYFFQCLCGCFFKQKERPPSPPFIPAAQTQPPPPPLPAIQRQPEPQPALPPAPRPLNALAGLRTNEQILTAFERRYLSDKDRKRIYAEIGASAPRGGFQRMKSDETVGREMVQKDPRLLLFYVIHEE